MWECNRLGNWKAGDGDWLQAWQDSETEQHLLTSIFPSSLPDFILFPAPSLPLALSWLFPRERSQLRLTKMAGVKHTSLSLSLGPGQGDVPAGLQDLPTSPTWLFHHPHSAHLAVWLFLEPSSLPFLQGQALVPYALLPPPQHPHGLLYPHCLQVLTMDCPDHLFTLSSLSWLFLFMDVYSPDVVIVTWYVFELFVSFQGNHEGCLFAALSSI